MIDIKGLDKGAVLKALHDGTRPLGLGWVHAIENMPIEQAKKEYEEALGVQKGGAYFDYYHGRPLKVDISGDAFDPRLYDRDAGEGVAEIAINAIR